jgi:lipid II:glycine glycyltransferase (peptidoglycan interpeptide bridge formation enzyme)
LKGSNLDFDALRTIADALRQQYAVKRGLYLRIVPNAYVDSERARSFETAFSSYGRERFRQTDSFRTLVLDLAPPLEQIRRNFDQKWRNQLNRAEKNGLTVLDGNSAELFDSFSGIYNEMVARKQFRQTSDLNKFRRAQEALPANQKLRVLVCLSNGTPAAGIVATAMGSSATYIFGATNEVGMKTKASYLMH